MRVYYQREFDAAEMRAQFGAVAARAPTSDDLVGEARTWAEQRTFQLGAHMARGAMPAVDASRPLTDIVFTCIDALVQAARREFAAEHGEMPNGRVALAALGAPGRRELAAGAPLPLLFVYDHDPVAPGATSLPPEDWHEQLVRRLMLLVHNLSPEGLLYEAAPAYALGDGQGRSPCSLAGLTRHFANGGPAADLRMLTHARVVAADGDLERDFEALRRSVLSRTHDLGAVVADIAGVRQRSRGRDDPWRVTDLAGGLVDLELTTQFLQLAGAAPETGVAALAETFRTAGERGLMDSDAARDLADAAALWQNLDGFFRMTFAGAFDPEAATAEQQAIIAEMCGVERFEGVPGRILGTARRSAEQVEALWSRWG